jgi:hypothetical protein
MDRLSSEGEGQSAKDHKPPVGGGLLAAALMYVGIGELARAARTGQITWVNRTKPNVLITHAEHPAAFDFMVALAIGSTLLGEFQHLRFVPVAEIPRWKAKNAANWAAVLS